MRPVTTICCSALALIALGAASSHDTDAPAFVPVRGVWQLPLNSQLTVAPAFDDTRAFFSLEQDRLVAYRIDAGKQLWLVESHPILQPATGGDLVFVAEASRLVALHATDGSDAWDVETSEPLALPPVWFNGRLVIVSGAGVRVLRAEDGQELWTHDMGTAPHAIPTPAADRVYFPLTDGRVVALGLADGAPVWERRIGGKPNEILVLGDRLYVGSTDNFFYCLMTKDGRIDWRWRTGGDVIARAVSDGSRVYFVSLDNIVRGMNGVTGGQLWLKSLPLRPTTGPQLAGATLLVVGPTQVVRTFNARDGAPGPEIDVGDEIAAPPHVVHLANQPLPMVLFVTKHVARGAGVSLQMRSIDPAATGLLAPLPNPVMPPPMPVTR